MTSSGKDESDLIEHILRDAYFGLVSAVRKQTRRVHRALAGRDIEAASRRARKAPHIASAYVLHLNR